MWRSLCTAVAAATLATGALAAGGKDHDHKHGKSAGAHQHGHVTLDVGVDGGTLTIALSSPLDSIVGFERAPRSDAERRTAADALARLRAPGTLFVPDAAAGCRLASANVEAPVLEGGTSSDGHADLDADYEYRCDQPQALRALQLGLFDGFPRIEQIVVQTATPAGQGKARLRRPAKTVTLMK